MRTDIINDDPTPNPTNVALRKYEIGSSIARSGFFRSIFELAPVRRLFRSLSKRIAELLEGISIAGPARGARDTTLAVVALSKSGSFRPRDDTAPYRIYPRP